MLHYNDEELKDTLFIRSILEREAVLLAKGRLTAMDMETMEALLIKMDECIEKNSLGRLPKFDSEFHFIIYNTVPSKQLREMIAKLWERFPRYALLSTNEFSPCIPRTPS